MEDALSSLIVGTIVACVLGTIAYLLKRLIDKNDEFQKDTRRNFRAIRQELAEQKISSANLRFSLEQKLEAAGLDEKTKTKMSSLLAAVTQVEHELTNIRPVIDESHQSNGKIIWIQDKLESQDKKLKGLYDVMIKIVHSQKR